MTEIHVTPDERTGTWRIYAADAARPLSEHTNVTDAQHAARALLGRFERVVVHDRYHRTHDAAVAPAAQRALARQKRARQLTHAREGAHQLAGPQLAAPQPPR